jgi:predicted metal-dependent hydrolase
MRFTRRDYLANKEAARFAIHKKLESFNAFYNHPYRGVSIRNQKTRWGSCSSRGNLNFNVKIVFLPESLQDYLIVHELCHLKELNHSKRFWDLVAQTIPDHIARRQQLRVIRFVRS